MESKFNIQAKIDKLNQAKADLPKQLANVGQTYWQLNFDKQSWNGTSWKPRKAGSYANRMAGHALLVGSTGDLRRSMQDTIKSFNWDSIVWSVKDVDYAGYINNGTIHMDKRQFMGFNDEINNKFAKKISDVLSNVMK